MNEQNWDKCPWCHKKVQIILDKTDKETDEYWRWVNEVKPPLPLKFQKHFLRLSRQRISEAMAFSVEKSTLSDKKSREQYELPVTPLTTESSEKCCKIL